MELIKFIDAWGKVSWVNSASISVVEEYDVPLPPGDEAFGKIRTRIVFGFNYVEELFLDIDVGEVAQRI